MRYNKINSVFKHSNTKFASLNAVTKRKVTAGLKYLAKCKCFKDHYTFYLAAARKVGATSKVYQEIILKVDPIYATTNCFYIPNQVEITSNKLGCDRLKKLRSSWRTPLFIQVKFSTGFDLSMFSLRNTRFTRVMHEDEFNILNLKGKLEKFSPTVEGLRMMDNAIHRIITTLNTMDNETYELIKYSYNYKRDWEKEAK